MTDRKPTFEARLETATGAMELFRDRAYKAEAERDRFLQSARLLLEEVDSPEDYALKGLSNIRSYIDLFRPLVAQHD
jgi:hypothetical protein